MVSCHTGSNQKWHLTGEGYLKTDVDDKCLDYNFNSGNTYMHACHGGNNQKWYLSTQTSEYRRRRQCNAKWLLQVTSRDEAETKHANKDRERQKQKEEKGGGVEETQLAKIEAAKPGLTEIAGMQEENEQQQKEENKDSWPKVSTDKRDYGTFTVYDYGPVIRSKHDQRCLTGNGYYDDPWFGSPDPDETAWNVHATYCSSDCTVKDFYAQHWSFSDGGQLKKLSDGKCAEYDTSNGNVHMVSCHTGSNQKWHLTGEGYLKTDVDDKCLDYNFNSGNTYMHACHGGNNQKWYLSTQTSEYRRRRQCNAKWLLQVTSRDEAETKHANKDGERQKQKEEKGGGVEETQLAKIEAAKPGLTEIAGMQEENEQQQKEENKDSWPKVSTDKRDYGTFTVYDYGPVIRSKHDN